MSYATFDGALELRAAGDGTRRLKGRFPYGKRAVIDSGGKGRRPKKEVFAPQAFSFAVNDPERRIDLLIGHSFDRPLASTVNETLVLNDTREALIFEATLTPEIQQASWVSDFLAGFTAGLIAGISPGFRVPDIEGAETVEEEDPAEGDALIRTIFDALLFELSFVTRPAYDETEADLRSRTWTRPLPRGPVNSAFRWRR